MIDMARGAAPGLVAAVSTHKLSVLRVTCKLGRINMRILRTLHTLLKAIPHRCYPLGVVYTNKGFFYRSAAKIDSFRVTIRAFCHNGNPNNTNDMCNFLIGTMTPPKAKDVL